MATTEATNGTWQQVRSRRRRLTYAQVVATPPRRSPSPTPPRYIRAPNSPTTLLFPPSHQLEEWDDRCFRCFRRGHDKDNCTNPTRCATCWGQDHEYRRCPRKVRHNNQAVSPRPQAANRHTQDHPRTTHQARQQQRRARPQQHQPRPYPKAQQQFGEHNKAETHHSYPIRKWIRKEPGFQDLLQDNTPNRSMLPEDDRVETVKCFVTRDAAFFTEVEELHKAVIVTVPTSLLADVSAASIATSFAKAADVQHHTLEVKKLSAARYLVTSKNNADAAHYASLLPEEWWVKGFKAERWSPMLEAGVQAIGFKVWVELVGLPPHLRREKYVAQVVGLFGVYLGSVPQQDSLDLTAWGFVVATPDLRCVPRRIVFTAGALEYNVRVVARRWMSGQVYSALDFPKLPMKILPPSAREPVIDVSGDSLTIKLQDLEKIFRHVPRSDIPTDIRVVLAEQAAAEQPAAEADPKGEESRHRGGSSSPPPQRPLGDTRAA